MKFDPEKYPLMSNGARAIPFSEWLPPDFEDVVSMGNAGWPLEVYYSPLFNKIIETHSDERVDLSKLDYWLKYKSETGTMRATQTTAKE